MANNTRTINTLSASVCFNEDEDIAPGNPIYHKKLAANTLRRYTKSGLIQKHDSGYVLTPAGATLLGWKRPLFYGIRRFFGA